MLRRILRVQYASDLHLEFGWANTKTLHTLLRPRAPILALAGDIGSLRDAPRKASYGEFLTACGAKWDHVLVVAGNHEYYGSDGVVTEECRAICDSVPTKNVHFLDRDRKDIDGIAFLGCTLWSDITGAEALIAARMNDCRAIPATPEDLKTWHATDRAWLEAELSRCREEGRGAVVITHHLPTLDVIAAKWKGHPLTPGFATALDHLIQEPVRAWICGHSHTASIVWKGDGGRIPVTLNPRGYPHETGTGFSREIWVDVRTDAGPGEPELDPELLAAATAATEEEIEFI